jgi:hypothetical protein
MVADRRFAEDRQRHHASASTGFSNNCLGQAMRPLKKTAEMSQATSLGLVEIRILHHIIVAGA